MEQQPKGDWTAYGTIISVSVLLCAAWLLTGSFWLTMAVMVLGMLHIAKDFPAFEEIIAEDPILLWLRKVSPLVIIGIFGFVLANTMWR